MNYGITVWGKQSSKLITLQKKAIRVIMKTGYRAHTDILFKDLFFLKIKDLCALLDYIFCYKFINHLLPDYFLTNLSDDYQHEHFTRARGNRRLPAVSHEFARQAISYKFPYSFNSMPDDIKSKIFTHSLNSFKTFIKIKFVNSYSSICTRSDCYVCNT